jgi:hypothetical protein
MPHAVESSDSGGSTAHAERACEDGAATALKGVVVDASRVVAADGTACRELTSLASVYRKNNTRLVFACLPGPVRDAMEAYGVDALPSPPAGRRDKYMINFLSVDSAVYFVTHGGSSAGVMDDGSVHSADSAAGGAVLLGAAAGGAASHAQVELQGTWVSRAGRASADTRTGGTHDGRGDHDGGAAEEVRIPAPPPAQAAAAGGVGALVSLQ